jgi:hypothetical protein
MEHVHRCTSVLRPLIAEGEPNAIPLAEKAINDLMDATPGPRQKASLESVQAIVQEHRDAAEGCQLQFADTINDYIEKLMRSFE